VASAPHKETHASVPPSQNLPSAAEHTAAEQSSGGQDGHGTIRRERRLVAAALGPTLALHQSPSDAKPVRPAVDAAAARRAPLLPPLFLQEVVEPKQKEPFGHPLAAAHGKAVLPTQPVTLGSEKLGLKMHQAQQTVSHPVRRRVCHKILDDFVQVHLEIVFSKFGARITAARLLVKWEWQKAHELCKEGELIGLVQHLYETELQMEHGETRKRVLEASVERRPLHGINPLYERRKLARGWDVARRELRAESIISLFLEGQLSWSRVRTLLQEAPVMPGDSDIFPS